MTIVADMNDDYLNFAEITTPLMVRGFPVNGYVVPPTYLTSRVTRPHPVWEQLVREAATSKQTRVIVPELDPDHKDFAELDLCALAGRVYVGKESVYNQVKGAPDWRFLSPTTNGFGNMELARKYLKYNIKAAENELGKRISRRGMPGDRNYFTWEAPMYYNPGPLNGRHRGEFAIVDIRSAHWTIHKDMTLDMAFSPGRFLGQGHIKYLHADEVTDYRELRRIIPGIAAMGRTEWIQDGVHKISDVSADLSSPAIVGYTQYTMHCMAREIIDKFSALMVLTDAYVIEEKYAEAVKEFLWERWGMDSEIQGRGESVLYGCGRYQIGDNKITQNAPPMWTAEPTVSYTTRKGDRMEDDVIDSSPRNTIRDVDPDWLCKRRKILNGN